ncbi:hypothetical protein J7K18_07920 [bacterium]|nr:hypothetical protein [bacterium]
MIPDSANSDEMLSDSARYSNFMYQLIEQDIPFKVWESIIVYVLKDRSPINIEDLYDEITDRFKLKQEFFRLQFDRALASLEKSGVVEFSGAKALKEVSLVETEVGVHKGIDVVGRLSHLTERIIRIVGKYVPDIADKEELRDAVMLMWFNLFRNYGAIIARYFSKDGLTDEEQNRFGSLSDLLRSCVQIDDRRVSSHIREIASDVADSLNEQDVELIFELLKGYTLYTLFGYSDVADNVVKERVEGGRLLLDTNILFPLVLEYHRKHPFVKGLLDVCSRYNIKVFVLEETVNELSRAMRRRMRYRNISPDVDFKIIYERRVDDDMIDSYYNYVQQEESPFSWEEYLRWYMENAERFLSDYGVEIIKEMPEDFCVKFTCEVASATKRRGRLVRGVWIERPKAKDEVDHDAKLLSLIDYWRRKERGNSGKYWLITWDKYLLKGDDIIFDRWFHFRGRRMAIRPEDWIAYFSIPQAPTAEGKKAFLDFLSSELFEVTRQSIPATFINALSRPTVLRLSKEEPEAVIAFTENYLTDHIIRKEIFELSTENGMEEKIEQILTRFIDKVKKQKIFEERSPSGDRNLLHFAGKTYPIPRGSNAKLVGLGVGIGVAIGIAIGLILTLI